jgi:hypothetical protein
MFDLEEGVVHLEGDVEAGEVGRGGHDVALAWYDRAWRQLCTRTGRDEYKVMQLRG